MFSFADDFLHGIREIESQIHRDTCMVLLIFSHGIGSPSLTYVFGPIEVNGRIPNDFNGAKISEWKFKIESIAEKSESAFAFMCLSYTAICFTQNPLLSHSFFQLTTVIITPRVSMQMLLLRLLSIPLVKFSPWDGAVDLAGATSGPL